MSHRIKILKSPNNETRITMFPVRRKNRSVREIAAEFLGVPDSELEEKASTRTDSAFKLPSLDIRSEFRTACSAHSYSRTEFGKCAKTRIMRSAGAMDKCDSRPWAYIFLTATLPSNDEWAKWAIAEYSPWIIDRMKSWLSKRLKERNEFYVWEHQDRGALHFHWCLYCPETTVMEKIQAEFRLEWTRLLRGVEKLSGISMWGRFSALSDTAKYCIVQVKAEKIRKSVAAYMAGYCGNGKGKHEKDRYIPYYPRRWFGVSRHLSAEIARQTETTEFEYDRYSEAKSAFDDIADFFCEGSVRSKKWVHNVGTGETSVHYHTPEKQQELWELRKMINPKLQKFPTYLFTTRLWVKIAATHSELTKSSHDYRTLCFSLPLGCLTDSLYVGSARRGNLRDIQVKATDSLLSVMSSHSSFHPSVARQFKDVARFCEIISHNYSRIRWNSHGYLTLTEDFEMPVDTKGNLEYSGTTGEESGTPTEGVDGSHGHVPSELNPSCHSHSQTSQLPRQQLTLPLNSSTGRNYRV